MSKVLGRDFLMCWYTGPAVALMVQSPTRKLWDYGKKNYGYYTGLNRITGQPKNYFLVHKADVKHSPDKFRVMTEIEAKKIFNDDILESLIALGQVTKKKTSIKKTGLPK